MNHVFRIIWSQAKSAWVVASELARCKNGNSGGPRAARGRSRIFRRLASPAPLYLAIVSTLALQAQATDRYWDINGNTAGLGGSGTWNTSNLFWNTSATGTGGTVTAWNNGALDDAFFGGTAGTVTLGEPITAHSLNFQANGYTLNGSTLTLGGTNPEISYTGGNQATINSVLAGSNGLTINGGSTNGFVLLGGNNTLTGGITVNSGARLVPTGSNSLNGANNVVTVNNGAVLQINNSNAFGGDTAAANLVINDGGDLWLGNQSLTHDVTAHGGTITIQDPFNSGIISTWNGSLTLTADTTLRVDNAGNGTIFSGNLSDTGGNQLSLDMSASGNLYLDGSNSFTGGITVNSGQLWLRGNDSAGAAAGNVVTINSGIVRTEGDGFGGDTDASQLILNDGGRLRVETNHTLNHDVTLTGGTANIDGLGNATWNGATVLTADTLLNLGVGNNNLTVGGPLQDTGGNVLSVSTFASNTRFNGDLSFSGDLTLGGGVNTWFDGGNYTYSGDTIITSNARLLLNGGGVSPNSNIRFEGLNNTHITIIYGTNAQPNITMPNGAGGGELRWAGTGGFYALNNQSDVTVNLGGAGATLTWNDGVFVPDDHALILGTNSAGGDARQVDFQNGIDLSGGLRQVRVDNGNLNDHALISGVLSGSGGLEVLGDGGLELTGNNTYSGDTVIGDVAANNIGHLILGSAGANSPNSNIQFDGFTNTNGITDSGMLMLTAAYGDFTDPLGTGAGQVQWTASGGFGAIGGDRAVNLGGAGATLTWGAGGFVPDGDVLRFGGRFSNSTVVWENGINLGATDRTINVNEGAGLDREVRLNGVIQGTGGLNLVGQGDVDLFGLNTYSGTTRIGNGTSASDNMFVFFDTFADVGTPSSFGTGPNIELASHNAGIIYEGATAASGNRNLALAGRHGSILQVRNWGGGPLEISGDIATTTSGAINGLRLGGTFISTDADGDGIAEDPNILSGVISDGLGTTEIVGIGGAQCPAGQVWRLTGANTFTGRIVTNGCDFEITTLADAGQPSSIGAATADPANFHFFNNGTVTYIGSGDSTDRLFHAWSNSTFESSGTGPVNFTNTGNILNQNGGFLHWLGGTNTDDNTLAATLVDAPTLQQFTTSNFSLGKRGPGLWALVTDSNAAANAYSNNTRIAGGALRLDNAGAITGGLGVTSNHGTAGSDQRSSLIVFEGANDGSAGVLGLTAASGGFFRGTTTQADAFLNNNGTADLNDDNYVQAVRWAGSGGFAAWDSTQVVNLFGDGRELTWGADGFVPTNQVLTFGYETADGTVDFQNGINLGGAARTVQVNDGLADRDAIISGALRGLVFTAGLTKTGDGTLTLTADNDYDGVTTIHGGVLEVGDGGTSGSLGDSSQVIVNAGTSLVINRSDALTLDHAITGDGTLVQRSTGTGTMTLASDIDHIVMEQGTLISPASSLETEDIIFTDDGGATFRVSGSLQTAGGTATLVSGGTMGDGFVVASGGSALVNGDLGDGNDLLDVAGTLDTGGVNFLLGNGDDTFTVRDGTNVIGVVDGGADTDTLNADIATSADLTQVLNFETLTKNGAGTLNVNGPGTSDFSTVNVNAGTLNVAAGAEIAAPVGNTITTTVASGATLNVDGSFGCGDLDDSITVAGNVSGGGTIDQCGGDDLLLFQDGADVSGFNGTFDGGAHTAGIGDTVQLDISTSFDFAQGTVINYENLLKSNTGTATLIGAQTYSGGVTINGGTLDVDGGLTTPTIDMTNAAGTTALNVDGLVQAAGGTQTLITGSAATNVVSVGAGAMLLATGDLGDGADTLDVAGTLNTGAGVFALDGGDDFFIIHDNTLVSGTVDGGAGIDTLDANIALVADLGAALNFETLTKTGVGTLNINGPGTSDFTTVNVNEGTLNVAAGAAVTPPVGGTLDTFILAGATLNVEGNYGCGDGADTISVSGTISGGGGGVIDQCGGDDTLTLNDGAVLNSTNPISGGAHTGGDTVVLNNTLALTFDGADVINYEFLSKQSSGTATLIGAHAYSGGSSILGGVLDVDGSLETPTIALADNTELNVDGLAQAAGATQLLISGSAGTNTVTVGAGGTLLATGGLGDGNDVLDVVGTLDMTGGGTFDLGDGDDTFIVHDATNVIGTVIAGAGMDTEVFDINGVANVGAITGFEGLGKRGTGTLNLTGPGISELVNVTVEEGILDVQAGATVVAQAGSPLDTTVFAGATLNVDGSYTASTLADTFDVSGIVSGTGTIDLNDGDDTLILNDGADLSGLANPLDGGNHAAGDTVVLNFSGNTTFSDTDTVNFEILTKQNTGTATLTGIQTWQQVNIDGGTLAVDDTLFAPQIDLADDTELLVNAGGTVDASPVPGDAAVITGSAGTNTVTVAAGGQLFASGDLGDGNDVLDLAGSLDTGGGIFSLGAGDDMFVVYDTTTAVGTVDGGTGNDLLNVNVGFGNTVPLGGLLGFESLGKSGLGTLQINGPSSFIDVDILQGLLEVTAGGSVAAQNTNVAAGASLQIDGSYTGTAGNDTFTVAGTVSGAGTLDLGDGDDTFTIQDGADLSGLANPVDGGAGTDTFVADLAGSATLGGAVNFETLTKTNTGTLTIAGPAMSAFSEVNLLGGTLDIGPAGSLADVQSATVAAGTTLNVDGSMLFTPGDDSFTVAGSVGGLGSIDMLAGDDSLTIQDGADLSGLANPVDGGAGTDTITADIAGSATLGGVVNFEILDKTNSGTLLVAGPAPSGITTVNVDGGTLDVGPAGSLTDVVATTVAAGATLNVDGSYSGSAGNDSMTISGTLSGAGPIDFGGGDDTLTLNDADLSGFSGVLDGGGHSGGDTVVLNNALPMTFSADDVINFENLVKQNSGTATLVGDHSYSQSTELQDGALIVNGGLETPLLAMGDDTVLTVNGNLEGGGGATTVFSGSAGTNTVQINGTALASGSLGDGADSLDVAGTLDTGAGAFSLGGGDDTFTIHDGTSVLGSVDGGAGSDILNANIAGSADLGAAGNFEELVKSNTGTLNINGPAESSFAKVQVLGGTLDIGPAGSLSGAANTFIDVGATLNVDGSYSGSAGNDVFQVAGAVSGGGNIGLGAGDDQLLLMEGADLGALANPFDGGPGFDTITAQVGTAQVNGALTLGPTVNFETLEKGGAGTLTLVGDQAYDTLDFTQGTIALAPGAALTSSNTNVGGDATLDLRQGSFSGTPGDDTFFSSGTVLGALAFGDGNDTATFFGGDISGITALDGGPGGADEISFHGLELNGDALPISGWENLNLLTGAMLTLGETPLDLDGGLLTIDDTSSLFLSRNASINASVDNAGLIDTGASRLAISGSYTGNNGLLQVLVSPAMGTSGGLDIAGDIGGRTGVLFTSDGSDVTEPTQIQVITSPNSAPGAFAPAGGPTVRLEGSIFPWTFAQADDNNWYLGTQAFGPVSPGILPELPAYAALPGLGLLMAGQSSNLVHQRLAGVRGSDRSQCEFDPEQRGTAASTRVLDDCRGFWVATQIADLELGDNPGFAVEGHDAGLYMGVDGVQDNGERILQVGVYGGYLDGNFTTSGAGSGGLSASGPAEIDLRSPVAGVYVSAEWQNRTFLEAVISGQSLRSDVHTEDGFRARLDGSSLAISTRLGRSFPLDNGWRLEPQLQLAANNVNWSDQVDPAGKQLEFKEGWSGNARAALRVEKTLTSASGAISRPWVSLAVDNTWGESRNSLNVGGTGPTATTQALPNYDLGTFATLDLGVEGQVSEKVSLFGTISVGRELSGTDRDLEAAANVGFRVRW